MTPEQIINELINDTFSICGIFEKNTKDESNLVANILGNKLLMITDPKLGQSCLTYLETKQKEFRENIQELDDLIDNTVLEKSDAKEFKKKQDERLLNVTKSIICATLHEKLQKRRIDLFNEIDLRRPGQFHKSEYIRESLQRHSSFNQSSLTQSNEDKQKSVTEFLLKNSVFFAEIVSVLILNDSYNKTNASREQKEEAAKIINQHRKSFNSRQAVNLYNDLVDVIITLVQEKSNLADDTTLFTFQKAINEKDEKAINVIIKNNLELLKLTKFIENPVIAEWNSTHQVQTIQKQKR